MGKKVQTYQRELIYYMEAPDMLIGKRALHESEWQMKAREQDGSSSSGYVIDAERARVDKVVFDKENAAVGPSYDNDTLTGVHHSNNDTFENVFALGIQNHEQPKVENCTKIKLLDEEISNNKSQACQKEKSFHKENEKYAQTDFSDFSYVASKEDNVNTGKKGLGDVMRKVQNQLSEEFEPLARNINLQLNCFEKSLVKEMKDDLKYVMSLEDEFDEKYEIETINIELEHSVAKLLTENEHLNKEKEHLKKTYKDLYDSIKKTRVQTKDQNDSLIAQLNKKSIENADLKAQIQKKAFATAALKNKLRKLKGNSVDTKFAKPSILGKPPNQLLDNQMRLNLNDQNFQNHGLPPKLV
ncbi:hypothetical protein Tco_1220424 [Tanacetum coccineum]